MEKFSSKKIGFDKAISSLTVQIASKNKEITGKKSEISALEKDTTSIQPTIDSINKLLLSFGFHSFSLEPDKNIVWVALDWVENHWITKRINTEYFA